MLHDANNVLDPLDEDGGNTTRGMWRRTPGNTRRSGGGPPMAEPWNSRTSFANLGTTIWSRRAVAACRPSGWPGKSTSCAISWPVAPRPWAN